MANLNISKAFIGGRVADEIELKTTNTGKAVCNFTIAVNRLGNEDGKVADYFNIVAWGKTAEFCSKFFAKGSSILVEGKVQNRSWQDSSGNKRYSTEIIADNVFFVDSRVEATRGGGKGENEDAIDELAKIADESEELPF